VPGVEEPADHTAAVHRRVPAHSRVLHAVRTRLPGPLGDRPAVLARKVRQQPEYQIPHPATGLNPREPARYPAHQDLERLLPAGSVYAGGHRKIFSLHTPMISGGRIIADISVSLDGFVTGPGPSPDNGLAPAARPRTRGRFPATPPAFVVAERNLGINRDAPDLRRLPVIR
jgi:hypothetical protein